jgi:SAM-dependent methyltransferase
MASPKAAKAQWGSQYWHDADGFRNISCTSCPKLDVKQQMCRVPFGTPLRKCVVAGIEAHLHDAKGKSVLELGFGRFSLAKTLINRSGGIWTGVEPHQPKDKQPKIGHGSYGHTEDIPFPDETFDMVFGIQTLEHWGQKRTGAVMAPSEYEDCIREILRVLKPGGTIYLDAPIHLHGNEMFIMGDIKRIKSHFPDDQWCNLVVERWRYDYQPLERYMPIEKLFDEWKEEITSYAEEEVEKVKQNPIWLLTISAEKRAS